MINKDKFYSDEVNAQIIVALLKANNISRVIASPGTTNLPIIGSVQNDPFFKVFSSVDERSAAYLACGMAYETGEPIVISCTGATASRNYMPGLTEAYYRKLPIIAITSTASLEAVGHLLPQCIDRSQQPKDIAKLCVTLPKVNSQDDFWDCEIKVNKAITECMRAGGGPVHINLATSYLGTFTTKELPKVRAIKRYTQNEQLPILEKDTKVAIFIGCHKPFSEAEARALEVFADSNNAVILCDHTSSYRGSKRILGSLPCFQTLYSKPEIKSLRPALVIHIGEISGDYPILGFLGGIECPTWRVSRDGEIRDRFKTISAVFEMPEDIFFSSYAQSVGQSNDSYYQAWKDYDTKLRNIPYEIPFSNTWIADILSKKLPINSALHLGILNSLRNWNLFEVDQSISSISNVGGFGIDGCLSTLIGAALASPSKLFFGVVGDLAFFYDLNALGNRHIPSNVRILLINNGGGGEFELSTHMGSQFGEQTGDYISAEGHFGKKSKTLVKDLASNLGFTYHSASSKDNFLASLDKFIAFKQMGPIIFECFTSFEDESNALDTLASLDKRSQLEVSTIPQRRRSAKGVAKAIIRRSIAKGFRMAPESLKRVIKDSIL